LKAKYEERIEKLETEKQSLLTELKQVENLKSQKEKVHTIFKDFN
jgi:flagellar biosynthesis/type III secretory pathway chaperone